MYKGVHLQLLLNVNLIWCGGLTNSWVYSNYRLNTSKITWNTRAPLTLAMLVMLTIVTLLGVVCFYWCTQETSLLLVFGSWWHCKFYLATNEFISFVLYKRKKEIVEKLWFHWLNLRDSPCSINLGPGDFVCFLAMEYTCFIAFKKKEKDRIILTTVIESLIGRMH